MGMRCNWLVVNVMQRCQQGKHFEHFAELFVGELMLRLQGQLAGRGRQIAFGLGGSHTSTVPKKVTL